MQFDYMMFKQATELVLANDGAVIQDFSVTEVNVEDRPDGPMITGVTGHLGPKKDGRTMSFKAPLTIGAAGYNCPVSRKSLSPYSMSPSVMMSTSVEATENTGRALRAVKVELVQ